MKNLSFILFCSAILWWLPNFAFAQTYNANITIDSSGNVTVSNGDRFRIDAGVSEDEMRYPILNGEGTAYQSFQATLQLPRPIEANLGAFSMIALNGVNNYSAQIVDAQTINYTANGIGPSAEITLIAKFPKGYFNLPPTTVAGVGIQALNPIWIYSSWIIPLFGIAILGYMWFRRYQDRQIPSDAQIYDFPPDNIPPALVSALYENKIEPEAIAATLIDLARRGYISIFNKGNNFIFAKEREIDLSTQSFQVGMRDVRLDDRELQIATQEGLHPFEKILLSKLFVAARPISSKEDVKVRIGHGIFSKKVAAIYEYLFRDASKLGYFVPNAITRHRKYLLAGWSLALVGFIGFLIGVWFLPDPKYFILFWVALMILAYLIIQLAPQIPLRTPEGRIKLAKFLGFRKYLGDDDKIEQSKSIDDFFALLPHAWAMGVHHEWAKRFENQVYHRPDWYYSGRKNVNTVEFVQDIDNLIDFVSHSFAAVREKTLA